MRSRVLLPTAALLAASAWCVALLVVRRQAFGGGERWLVWNLTLAWVPFALALVLWLVHRRRHTTAELLALGAAWLVFLPNAPYMLTDFVHLGTRHRLFDSIVLASFAFTALALGFASLVLVLQRPHLLASIARARLEDPFGNRYLIGFVIAVGGFLTLAYLTLWGVAALTAAARRD